jgi:hypothetical protein
MQKIPFQSLFRNANPDALDLLDRLRRAVMPDSL